MQVGVYGEHAALAQTEQTMLVETVRGKFEGFTKKEISQATAAHQAQVLMGDPSNKDYKGMVSNHLISNCPITHTDIANAHRIFGPDLSSVRGKTIRWALAPVVSNYVAVPV